MNTELYIPTEFDSVSIAINEKEHPTDQRVASYTFYDGYHENTLTNLLLLIKRYGFGFHIHWLECKDKDSKVPSIDITIDSEEELAKIKRMNSEIMRKYKIADMA